METLVPLLPKIASPIRTHPLLDDLDILRLDQQKAIDKEHQAEMGQFLTPQPIATMMAEMFREFSSHLSILDPGAGIGTLSAALIIQILESSPLPKAISLTAYEVDAALFSTLESTLFRCQTLCKQKGISFQFYIRKEDFIQSSINTLIGINSLFPIEQPYYNLAILNPPYKKINSSSKTRKALNSVGIETSNLYSAFLWLTMKMLIPEGELVAIIPRSFCNGSYFKPFRTALLQNMRIKRIHTFESRDQSFKDGEVLQENIILHAKKTQTYFPQMLLTSSLGPDDQDVVIQNIEYSSLVRKNDSDQFIRITPDYLGRQISQQMDQLPCSLDQLGLTVSTGKVVDFRAKEFLRETADTDETIPLIYPGHFQNGSIIWPRGTVKKACYLSSTPGIEKILVPAQYYVLVKRFSSKEEKRRVYAAILDPQKIPVKRIGIENHVNYLHKRYGNLPLELARGLSLYLNSTLVDEYFRQFSGNTQVNVTDLRSLRYPTEKQLISLGKKAGNSSPTQNEIDQLLSEELGLNNTDTNSTVPDPVLAKQKIEEALDILRKLNVPKAQQNDRSALTLLALVDMRSTTAWSEAAENLIGITEMLYYFREHYGVDYAPNTRETVRRETIHQLMQMELVISNPDQSDRPINSPRTRYTIEPAVLQLIRTYGTSAWNTHLEAFLKSAAGLSNLQIRERSMPMIPVILPEGKTRMISAGGQNSLLKQVVEDFCPRYTPGGKVIYLGDAGKKITEEEQNLLSELGISLDVHGKMPDVVISLPDKKWLVLIEAVTSHGPINQKRHNELKELFGKGAFGLVFVTAFATQKVMRRYMHQIDWETEVWVAETPSHIIHFNGERFLGPYPS